MTKAIDIKAIEKGTGKSWDKWLAFLGSINASELPHKEIAQKVYDHGAGDWWAQSVTVAYEQHIGRRVPGQTSNGKFQVSVSKTVDGTKEEALEKWLAVVKGQNEFNGVTVAREPASSAGGTFRYWHCGLSDSSRVSVSIYEKAPGKSVVGLGHENLASADDVEPWRAHWKSLLGKI
jgi:hypothetical protein